MTVEPRSAVPQSKVSGLSGLVDLFRQRPYGIYAIANGLSLVGNWTQRVVVAWLAWDLTQSATWLGVLAFADLAPTVLIGLLAGTIIDRRGSVAVVVATEVAGLLQAMLLLVLWLVGLLGIEALVVTTLILGVVTAFNHPARLTLAPQLVSRRHLPLALVVNATLFNVARFVGPALAGAMLAAHIPASAFLFNILTYGVVLAVLTQVRTQPRTPLAQPALLSDIAAGFSAAWQHPATRDLLLLLFLSGVAARSAVELLPAVSDQLFNANSGGLAALTSAIGLGAVLGGLILMPLGVSGTHSFVILVTLSTALLAGSNAVMVLTGSFPVALAMAGLGGACTVAGAIGTLTVLQTTAADDMRGRILSLYGILLRGSPALGALVLGVAADHHGLTPSVVVSSTLIAPVCAWLLWRHRRGRADGSP